MAKIFLEVHVPGNDKTYEFSVDNSMTIAKVKDQVMDQITELENRELFLDRQKTLFCCVNLNGMLRGSDTLSEVNVKSGYKLILL